MTNEQLVQYVAAGRARGVSDDAMRTELLNTGWHEADVSEALHSGGQLPPVSGTNDGFFKRLPRGRIGRMRYFLGSLTLGVIAVIPFFILIASWGLLGSVMYGSGYGENDGLRSTYNILIPIGMFLALIFIFLPLVYINFMLQVRRLHDLDMSGWFLLVNFVPFIGPLFGLYVLFMPGNAAQNKYGPPPSMSRGFMDDILNK